MTSGGAPPVVRRQQLWLRKYSFHSFWRTSGNSFLISLEEALLYALMNRDKSLPGWALKRICTWSVSSISAMRCCRKERSLFHNKDNVVIQYEYWVIIIVQNCNIMRRDLHYHLPTTNRIILYFYYEFIPSFTLRKKKGTSSLWSVKKQLLSVSDRSYFI